MREMPKLYYGIALLLLLGHRPGDVAAQWIGEPVAALGVGRPLQWSAPVRLPPGEGAECISADVFHGARQLLPGQVGLQVSGEGEQRVVKVEGRVPIDEPMVDVVLRVGCRSPLTRRVSLLPASPVAEAPAIAAAAAVESFPAAPVRATTPAAQRRSVRPAVSSSSSSSSRPAVAAAAPRPSRPVLRMEPLDLAPTQLAQGMTRELPVRAPVGDEPRAQAAALWKALQDGPEDRLRTSTALAAVEADLARLRQQTLEMERDLAALQARTRGQELQWGWRSWGAGLLALALALAVAVAWVARAPRGRREKASPPREGVVEEWTTPSAAASAWARHPAFDAAPAAMVDAPDLQLVDRDTPAGPAPVGPEAAELPPEVRLEQLLTAMHEADFLRMLGQGARAIAALQGYIASAPAPAPVAYLAWMELCEAAGDLQALDDVAQLYGQAFACEPPPRLLLEPGWGLERHAAAAAQVVAAWNTPERTAVLAQLLFAPPQRSGGLSLQAGRDLLFLFELDATLGDLRHPSEEAGQARDAPVWLISYPPEAAESSWVGFDVDLGELERSPPPPARTGPATLV